MKLLLENFFHNFFKCYYDSFFLLSVKFSFSSTVLVLHYTQKVSPLHNGSRKCEMFLLLQIFSNTLFSNDLRISLLTKLTNRLFINYHEILTYFNEINNLTISKSSINFYVVISKIIFRKLIRRE